MIKTIAALSLTVVLSSCVSSKPVVVDKNVYVAVALDDAFFSEENCPKPARPPSASKEDGPIKDTDVARHIVKSYENNKICNNTIQSIKQKNDEGIQKVNRLNAEKKD